MTENTNTDPTTVIPVPAEWLTNLAGDPIVKLDPGARLDPAPFGRPLPDAPERPFSPADHGPPLNTEEPASSSWSAEPGQGWYAQQAAEADRVATSARWRAAEADAARRADPARAMRDVPFAASDPVIGQEIADRRSRDAAADSTLAAMLVGLEKIDAVEQWAAVVTPGDTVAAIRALARTLARTIAQQQ